MTVWLDYGKIQRVETLPDGRVRGYARIARTGDMAYYLQKDGRIERVMRHVPKETLLDAKSMLTAADQYLLKGHTPDNGAFASPTNLGQVIGHTGTIPLAEEMPNDPKGGVLGILFSITTKDGLDYWHSGNKQFSPEYTCDLRLVDGKETQFNRDHKGIAIVPQARGGDILTAKDSIDIIDPRLDLCWVDHEFIRDERERWDFPLSARDALVVDRYLGLGTLNPDPIILNLKPEETMTLQKTKIGDRTIEHSPECLRDAIEIEKEFALLKQRLADAEDQMKDYKQLQADVVVLTDQNKKLKDAADAAPKQIQEAVTARIKDAAQCQEDIKIFAANGRNVTAAKDALDKFDIEGYKAAILADMAAPAGVTLDYASVLHSYKSNPLTAKDMAPIPTFEVVAPPGMAQSHPMAGSTAGLFGSSLNLGSWSNGLPPDDAAHNWY